MNVIKSIRKPDTKTH